jgi:hypothetical protein
VTISDFGWVVKEQLVNEWLEKCVHHQNFRTQTKCLWIKLHTHCTNNKEDMPKKNWKMNILTLHYYRPAGETIHKKHYCIVIQHFKFCCGVESTNTYFSVHLTYAFYLKKIKLYSHTANQMWETAVK